MTETRPKIADDLRFEPGQMVRIRKSGQVGLVTKVYRMHWDNEWQHVVRYRNAYGYEEEVVRKADEIAAWRGS